MRAAARRTIRRGGGALDRDNTRKRVEFMKRRQSQVSHRRCRVLGLRPVQRLRLPPRFCATDRNSGATYKRIARQGASASIGFPKSPPWDAPSRASKPTPRTARASISTRVFDTRCGKSDAACAVNPRKKLCNSLRDDGPFADEKMRAMMSV